MIHMYHNVGVSYMAKMAENEHSKPLPNRQAYARGAEGI